MSEFPKPATNCATGPEAEKQRYADEHREGWGDFLDRLARASAELRSG
jgi:hypothetical protein